MPILVDYTPSVPLMQLAADSGTATGNAAFRARQAPIDQMVTGAAIQSAQRSAAAPTFAQQHTGTGQTQYAGTGPVQTFVDVEERARAERARGQYEAVYGNPAQQRARREQGAAVTGYAAATGGKPEAAQYMAGAVRRGEKPPEQIESAAIGLPPAQQVQQQRNTATAGYQALQAASTAKQAEAAMVRAKRPTTAPLNMAEIRKQQDRVRAAFDSDPDVVVTALEGDPIKGLTPAMVEMMGGLNDPSIDPAKRLARAAELAAAGAPETAVAAMRKRALAQQDEEAAKAKMEKERAKAVATAAQGIIQQIGAGQLTPEEVPTRAMQLGIPLDQLEEQIRQQWEAAGRPAPR